MKKANSFASLNKFIYNFVTLSLRNEKDSEKNRKIKKDNLPNTLTSLVYGFDNKL